MKTETPGMVDGEQLLAHAADIEIASRSLKAMSHPLRLKILCTLGSGEACLDRAARERSLARRDIEPQ